MNERTTTMQGRIGRVVVSAALLVLSLIVLIDHIRITRLEEPPPTSDEAGALEQLASRYSALSGDVKALKEAPRGVGREAIDALRSEWVARMSQLEETIAASATSVDLSALKGELRELEARYSRPKQRPPASTATAEATSSVSPASAADVAAEPPFAPLGIELRGGERFLIVLPAAGSSLAQARAIHPGEWEGSWLLVRVEREAAYFQVAGRLRRVSVPQ